MKRFLICLLAFLLLACTTPTGIGDEVYGSFNWAYKILTGLAFEWRPGADLSHFQGFCLDSSGNLIDDPFSFWRMTFTWENETYRFTIIYSGETWGSEGLGEPGPEISYTNARINRLLIPVLAWLEENYPEDDYLFEIEAEFDYGYDNPCAGIGVYNSNGNLLFRALVDTVTYEILVIF